MASALLTEVHIVDTRFPKRQWMGTLHPGRLQKPRLIAVTRRRRLPLVQECLCQTMTRVWPSTTRRGFLPSAHNLRAQILKVLGPVTLAIPPQRDRRPPEVDPLTSLRNMAPLERRPLACVRPSVPTSIWSKHLVRRWSTLCVHIEDHFEYRAWPTGDLKKKNKSSLSIFMAPLSPRML